MFNLIILVIIDIASEVLFNSLIESFYLSIGLKIKDYRKFVIHSEFYYEYCEESKDKSCTFIYYKFI